MMGWRCRILRHLPYHYTVYLGRASVTYVNWTAIGDHVILSLERVPNGFRVGCPAGALVFRSRDWRARTS